MAFLASVRQVTLWVEGLSIARFRQRRFLCTAIAGRVAQRYPSADGFLCGFCECRVPTRELRTMKLSNTKSRRGAQKTRTSALLAHARVARPLKELGTSGVSPRGIADSKNRSLRRPAYSSLGRSGGAVMSRTLPLTTSGVASEATSSLRGKRKPRMAPSKAPRIQEVGRKSASPTHRTVHALAPAQCGIRNASRTPPAKGSEISRRLGSGQ